MKIKSIDELSTEDGKEIYARTNMQISPGIGTREVTPRRPYDESNPHYEDNPPQRGTSRALAERADIRLVL